MNQFFDVANSKRYRCLKFQVNLIVRPTWCNENNKKYCEDCPHKGEPMGYIEHICEQQDDQECETCRLIKEKKLTSWPSHDGSKNCESGSIASGGANSHCSCDICF